MKRSREYDEERPHVVLLQAENRPLTKVGYMLLSNIVNLAACEEHGWEYVYKDMREFERYTELVQGAGWHPATFKIEALREFMRSLPQGTVLIFLDSDAWIHDGFLMHRAVMELWRNREKVMGAFSRDPYMKKNTFVNSGSFMLIVNANVLMMYDEIFDTVMQQPSHKHEWPFDQFYISDYVHKHRGSFIVWKDTVINTPIGSVIKHNWFKDGRMWVDLWQKVEKIESGNQIAIWKDDQPYPNTVDGNEYQT